MTKEELLKRIKEKIPYGAVVKFFEGEFIAPAIPAGEGYLYFKLELRLVSRYFTRGQALLAYETFRKLLPESEKAVFEEKLETDWEYNLQFDIIGINETPDEEDVK